MKFSSPARPASSAFTQRSVLLERGDEVVGLDNLNDYYDVTLKEARLAQLRAASRTSASSSSTSPIARGWRQLFAQREVSSA